MTNKLARQTISAIEKALESKKTAAIGEIIQIIQELASKAFSISVAELSELIGRDATITEKVISAANTLGFNPNGLQIATITEAIHTVGFEKIRNLAISLLLVENAGHSLNPYEQREMAAMAVCSGLLAQRLVEKTQSSVDAELAFVCTSLRNYGKLLMTTFLIDKYREARSLALDLQDDDMAFRKVFGLTPLQLGQYLLQSTSLPKSIMSSFRSVSPETLAKVASTAEEQVVVLAEACVKVCEISFDEEVRPDQFNDRLMGVIDKFGRSVPIGLEMLNETLVEIESSISIFNRAIGVQEASSPALQKIRARISGEPLPERPPEARPRPSSRRLEAATDGGGDSEGSSPQQTEAAFQEILSKITQNIEPGGEVNLGETYTTATQAILEGLKLDACMAFVSEDGQGRAYSARYGYGNLFNRIRNRPVVSEAKKDVFSICLARREDILIQDVNAGKIRSVVPDWVSDHSHTHSFVLLPLKSKQRLYAIFFGSMEGDRSIQLGEDDLRRLRLVRGNLIRLLEMVERQEISVAP